MFEITKAFAPFQLFSTDSQPSIKNESKKNKLECTSSILKHVSSRWSRSLSWLRPTASFRTIIIWPQRLVTPKLIWIHKAWSLQSRISMINSIHSNLLQWTNQDFSKDIQLLQVWRIKMKDHNCVSNSLQSLSLPLQVKSTHHRHSNRRCNQVLAMAKLWHPSTQQIQACTVVPMPMSFRPVPQRLHCRFLHPSTRLRSFKSASSCSW